MQNDAENRVFVPNIPSDSLTNSAANFGTEGVGAPQTRQKPLSTQAQLALEKIEASPVPIRRKSLHPSIVRALVDRGLCLEVTYQSTALGRDVPMLATTRSKECLDAWTTVSRAISNLDSQRTRCITSSDGRIATCDVTPPEVAITLAVNDLHNALLAWFERWPTLQMLKSLVTPIDSACRYEWTHAESVAFCHLVHCLRGAHDWLYLPYGLDGDVVAQYHASVGYLNRWGQSAGLIRVPATSSAPATPPAPETAPAAEVAPAPQAPTAPPAPAPANPNADLDLLPASISQYLGPRIWPDDTPFWLWEDLQSLALKHFRRSPDWCQAMVDFLERVQAWLVDCGETWANQDKRTFADLMESMETPKAASIGSGNPIEVIASDLYLLLANREVAGDMDILWTAIRKYTALRLKHEGWKPTPPAPEPIELLGTPDEAWASEFADTIRQTWERILGTSPVPSGPMPETAPAAPSPEPPTPASVALLSWTELMEAPRGSRPWADLDRAFVRLKTALTSIKQALGSPGLFDAVLEVRNAWADTLVRDFRRPLSPEVLLAIPTTPAKRKSNVVLNDLERSLLVLLQAYTRSEFLDFTFEYNTATACWSDALALLGFAPFSYTLSGLTPQELTREAHRAAAGHPPHPAIKRLDTMPAKDLQNILQGARLHWTELQSKPLALLANVRRAESVIPAFYVTGLLHAYHLSLSRLGIAVPDTKRKAPDIRVGVHEGEDFSAFCQTAHNFGKKLVHFTATPAAWADLIAYSHVVLKHLGYWLEHTSEQDRPSRRCSPVTEWLDQVETLQLRTIQNPNISGFAIAEFLPEGTPPDSDDPTELRVILRAADGLADILRLAHANLTSGFEHMEWERRELEDADLMHLQEGKGWERDAETLADASSALYDFEKTLRLRREKLARLEGGSHV